MLRSALGRSTGALSTITKATPKRIFGPLRFYPRTYPRLDELGALNPDAMYPRPQDPITIAAIEKADTGPWHDLSDEERQRIYRAYFPATLAEMRHPPSYWKPAYGWCLILSGLTFPVAWWCVEYMFEPAPYTEHPQFMEMMDDRMDALHMNPIWGEYMTAQGGTMGRGDQYYDGGKAVPQKPEGY